jgi:hypothetical protein
MIFDYLTLIGMAKDENDRAAFKGQMQYCHKT